MIAMLWKLRGAIAVGLAALTIIGLWLMLKSAQIDRDAAQGLAKRVTDERNIAVDLANRNAEAVDQMREEHDNVLLALDAARRAAATRQTIIVNTTKEMANAKPAQCPAADRLVASDRGLLELVGAAKAGD